MTDSGSNTRLEPFLLLAKSTKGSACAKLIQDATETAGLFVFTELLEMPNIDALKSDEKYSKNYEMLKLFAYGTYQDFKNMPQGYMTLNSKQLIKLKLLSLVTLASENKTLKYDDLLKYLDIPNVRELEDLLIEAIYQNVIQGKLDQRKKQVNIECTMCRDLVPGQLKKIKDILYNWLNTTESVIIKLNSEIERADKEITKSNKEKEEYDNSIKKLIEKSTKDERMNNNMYIKMNNKKFSK